MGQVWSLPLITYAPRGRGVKPPIHFYCVLHAKRMEGVQKACINEYVINGRPYSFSSILPDAAITVCIICCICSIY